MGGWVSFQRDLLEQLPLILAGLRLTLELTVVISITGLLFGVVVFYFSVSRNSFIQLVTRGYVSFFIGTPLIVLLFLMYYGLPQWGLKISPFWVAVIDFYRNESIFARGDSASFGESLARLLKEVRLIDSLQLEPGY